MVVLRFEKLNVVFIGFFFLEVILVGLFYYFKIFYFDIEFNRKVIRVYWVFFSRIELNFKKWYLFCSLYVYRLI